jgi:hypothetical protein
MKNQDEIQYYIEELTFVLDQVKAKFYGRSVDRFKDFDDFKEFITPRLDEIFEGIDYHKSSDFEE